MNADSKNNFTESDIRPDNLMELKKPALEHDKEYLRSRKLQFVKTNCVACNSDKINFWAEKEGFNYDSCEVCGTIFMNPRAGESLQNEFYKQSKNYEFWNKYIFPQTNSVREKKIFQPRVEKTIEFCEKYKIQNGTLLEIGAGYGSYCELIRGTGYFSKVIALEPISDLAETCRRKGLLTLENTIEEIDENLMNVDVISNFEVIEHLYNPKKFIEKSYNLLNKNGLFICTCPNGLSIGTVLQKGKANFIDHEHVNYFNPESISVLLKNSGFEILEIFTPGKLDADIIRKSIIRGELKNQDFLKFILVDRWEKFGSLFQNFIIESKLSSNMWVVAKK